MKYKKNTLIGWCARAICVSTFFVIWGCSSGAHVVTGVTIPEPLIDSFPISVGIYYSTELTEFVYNEKKGRQTFVVELGGDQEQVFENSLGALFHEITTLDSMEDFGNTLDGVFYPSISGVTVAIPAETGRDYYEVLIRYDLQLLDPDGEQIHKWVVSAYGKVNRRDYGNVMERTNEALQQATENALRDASTQIILLFNPRRRPTTVSDWISLNVPSQPQEEVN